MGSSKEDPFRAKAKPRIQLDSDYAYRSLDKVRGKIDHSGIEADKIKLHLIGTTFIAQTRFVSNAYRVFEKEWEFLKLSQKCVLESTSSTSSLFSFRLPEALIEGVCPLRNPFHLLLPPTIGCKREDHLDDLSPKDPVNARIEYAIVAEIYKAGELVQTFREPFRVAPRHFTSPQTMNPPPGYDETINLEGDVTRAIGGKIGVLKLKLQQPPGLLSSLEAHQLTTSVPLAVEFHSITSQPPRIMSIGIKLLAVTSSRTEHLLEGSGDDVRRTTEARLNKLAFSKSSAPTWTNARPGVFATNFELPVTLCPKGFVAIPEFESCLVTRSYSLMLKFEFNLPGSSLPLSELRMKLPTWVFADEFYGIPSEEASRPGAVPIKNRRRWEVPQDINEDRSSLPNYEDTYLTNVAVPEGSSRRHPAQAAAAAPVIIGNEGTRAAPFALQGMEPDYFQPEVRRSNNSPVANQSASIIRARGRQASIHGYDPSELITEEPVVDEADRVPAWQIKEEEERTSRSQSLARDPREQRGAQ